MYGNNATYRKCIFQQFVPRGTICIIFSTKNDVVFVNCTLRFSCNTQKQRKPQKLYCIQGHVYRFYDYWYKQQVTSHSTLIQCGLVLPYGHIHLGQHWLKQCLLPDDAKSLPEQCWLIPNGGAILIVPVVCGLAALTHPPPPNSGVSYSCQFISLCALFAFSKNAEVST